MASVSSLVKLIGNGASAAAKSANKVATASAAKPAAAPAQPAAPATPYLDIAKAYEQQARANLAAQEGQLATQLAASKNASNRQYEGAANANYINYMKQRNALPEQLAAQHINGGASETANVNMLNNYALTRGNTEASRIAALGQLQSTYDTNIANMRQQAEDNILNNRLALAQAQAQYEDTLAQRAIEEARYKTEQDWKQKEYNDSKSAKVLEQYAATISRYTNTESIDKAIKKLKENKPTNYKQMIWLLQQRKAELNGTGGGSGGSGGGSYSGGGRGSGGSSSSGGSGSGSGSGSTSLEDPTPKVVKAAKKTAGAVLNNKAVKKVSKAAVKSGLSTYMNSKKNKYKR